MYLYFYSGMAFRYRYHAYPAAEFSQLKTLSNLPSAWGWVDTDWIFIFGWTFPLNLSKCLVKSSSDVWRGWMQNKQSLSDEKPANPSPPLPTFCCCQEKSHLAIADTKSSYCGLGDWHKINVTASAAGTAYLIFLKLQDSGRKGREGSKPQRILTDGPVDCIMWPWDLSLYNLHGQVATVVKSSL